MSTVLGAAPRPSCVRQLTIRRVQLAKGMSAKSPVHDALGKLVSRLSSTCMATRWHRGDRTSNRGRHAMIGLLRLMSLLLINRTIVVAVNTPDVDLTLHCALGLGSLLSVLTILAAFR